MQAQRLPAARGWWWIAQGFRLFRRNPPLLTFLVFGYWFLLVIVNLVPMIGWIASSLCMPALSVSVLNGCRAIDRDEQTRMGLLLSGFQRNLPALVALGGLYLVASVGAIALSALADGGSLMQAMFAGRPPHTEEADGSQMLLALQLALLAMVPVLMAFWFAPVLAAWDECTAGKALFFSIVASVRNWRAFAVYGLSVAVITAILPGILLGMFAAVSKSLLNIMVVALTLPLMFVFVPTLFASFYVSYREVFSPAPAGNSAGGNADAPAN
jgi:hypothetical protein